MIFAIVMTAMKVVAYRLSYVVAVLFSVAIVGYILTSFGEPGEPVGFQLATISAVIGGLILAGGMLGRGQPHPDSQLRLRRIGTLYLVATLAFVVFGICHPLMGVSGVFVFAAAAGMSVGALAFGMGSVLLATEVPRLWSGS